MQRGRKPNSPNRLDVGRISTAQQRQVSRRRRRRHHDLNDFTNCISTNKKFPGINLMMKNSDRIRRSIDTEKITPKSETN